MVDDFEKARKFFIRYFDAKSDATLFDPHTGKGSCKLFFCNEDEEIRIAGHESRQDTHANQQIDIRVGSKEKVEDITERLWDDGYTVVCPPDFYSDKTFESCIVDSDGNRIKIIA